jgi:hypothetical protein
MNKFFCSNENIDYVFFLIENGYSPIANEIVLPNIQSEEPIGTNLDFILAALYYGNS